MRTLLRKVSTGLYFEGPDKWTRNPDEAHDFKMIDMAVRFIQTWGLKDVELAFAFRNREFVKAVPLEKLALHYSEK